MTRKKVTVTVSGAAGQIGYATLFRLASGQVFGPDVDVALRLLELEASMGALSGVAMELEDCAFPQLVDVTCTSDVNHAMKGTNWALLIGAVPRKAGMERSDLLQVNGGIFGPQGRAINDHAADDVRVFVVGNPCNTNCLIAMHSAPDVPNDRFYAMTKLDENRARTQLAVKAGVPVKEVTRLAVWGNHSSTQYPDFYHALIQGKPVTEVITDEKWLQNDFIATVQQRGAAVIKARGASSAASAANAALGTVHDLITETHIGNCYSVASCSQGDYGIEEGLIFSFPSVTLNGKLWVIRDFEQNAFGTEKIKVTYDELIAERDAVRALKLID